ncbi:MAG: hypothetical protein ACTHME_00770 [Candidatus Nitrosocosmicus sp.]
MIITKDQYKNYRHIIVSRLNYDELKKRGNMRDSFNDVITKLLLSTKKKDDANSRQNLASSPSD